MSGPGGIIILTNNGDNCPGVLDDNSGDETIYGLDGDDIIFGGAGNDVIDGGLGADHLSGGDGGDRLITGTSGLLSYNKQIQGGDGFDTPVVACSGTSRPLSISVNSNGTSGSFYGSGTDISSSYFYETERYEVTGTASADTITTGNNDDIVIAGAGNDIVTTRDGNDTINGGEGADTLDGGTNGLAGDTLSYAGSCAR